MEGINWIESQVSRTMDDVTLPGAREEDVRLRQTCKEFETVLASAMVKEGLKGAMKPLDDEEESDSSTNAYMDMVQSQMSQFLGQQGVLGIADTLYEQLNGLPTPAPRL